MARPRRRPARARSTVGRLPFLPRGEPAVPPPATVAERFRRDASPLAGLTVSSVNDSPSVTDSDARRPRGHGARRWQQRRCLRHRARPCRPSSCTQSIAQLGVGRRRLQRQRPAHPDVARAEPARPLSVVIGSSRRWPRCRTRPRHSSAAMASRIASERPSVVLQRSDEDIGVGRGWLGHVVIDAPADLNPAIVTGTQPRPRSSR